eukprot:4883783-Amphidinium_carterae.1
MEAGAAAKSPKVPSSGSGAHCHGAGVNLHCCDLSSCLAKLPRSDDALEQEAQKLRIRHCELWSHINSKLCILMKTSNKWQYM